MSTTQTLSAVSKLEFNNLVLWLDADPLKVPSARDTFSLKRIIATYGALIESERRAKSTLFTLRQAMGIIQKSERGSTQNDAAALAAMTQELRMSDDQRAELGELNKKRSQALENVKDYNRKIKSAKSKFKAQGEQFELDFARPCEALFSYPVVIRDEEQKNCKVNRMTEFNKERGFHSTKDKPKRINLRFVAEEITYDVETLTDLETGKTVRASTKQEGPDGSQMTWGSIANLLKLHVGFAIPINRLSLMIGQPEFSSGKICTLLSDQAFALVGIYLQLADELSDAHVLSGDDTKTKVLAPYASKPDAICDPIDTQLGWIQPRADGSGPKKALNVSLLVGRTQPDPRSTIRFFRTHIGSVGNLLTKMLESRSTKARDLIFQGDLSTSNLPEEQTRQNTNLRIAGCGAHARRPFWKHKDQDMSLCYFMLKCFLALSEIETKINATGRTRHNILRLRSRYGRWIWVAMKNRCIAAVTGKIPGIATFPKDIKPDFWPPNTDLNEACNYVINHFDALTLYLTHPELEYTNNAQERALRIEKLMLSGSKFRKTKRGRVTLDILRTINSSATAAQVDLTHYLCWFYMNTADAAVHPERYTPFAFAQHLDCKKKETSAPSANMLPA